MSLDNAYWGGRGNCPVCGRFCGHIVGYGGRDMPLSRVTGDCKVHGQVDLTDQAWNWDEFFGEEEEEATHV